MYTSKRALCKPNSYSFLLQDERDAVLNLINPPNQGGIKMCLFECIFLDVQKII